MTFAYVSLMPIRNARKEDIPQMVELLLELFSMEQDFPLSPVLHSKGLELLLGNSKSSVLVFSSESGKVLLGMVTLQPHISTAFGCRDAILEDLVVRREFRRRGIGTQLLRRAELEAGVMGYQRLRLAKDLGNKSALSFYLKEGWSQGRMVSLYRDLTQM